MMDAIVSAWVQVIGGEATIGSVCAILFLFSLGFVFYKIST